MAWSWGYMDTQPANRRFLRETINIYKTAWSDKTIKGKARILGCHMTAIIILMKTPFRQLFIPVMCELGIWPHFFFQSRSPFSTLMLMTSHQLQLEDEFWSLRSIASENRIPSNHCYASWTQIDVCWLSSLLLILLSYKHSKSRLLRIFLLGADIPCMLKVHSHMPSEGIIYSARRNLTSSRARWEAPCQVFQS